MLYNFLIYKSESIINRFNKYTRTYIRVITRTSKTYFTFLVGRYTYSTKSELILNLPKSVQRLQGQSEFRLIIIFFATSSCYYIYLSGIVQITCIIRHKCSHMTPSSAVIRFY